MLELTTNCSFQSKRGTGYGYSQKMGESGIENQRIRRLTRLTKEAKKMEVFNKENLSRDAFEELERPDRIPCCDSIEDFLSFLKRSQEYRDAVAKRHAEALRRFQQIRESDGLPPTLEEAAPIYEKTSDFKQLFWNFEQDVVHLRYKPDQYNPMVKEKIGEYLEAVRRFQGVFLERGIDADKIASADQKRKIEHNKAARALQEAGLVPNFFVGRIIVRAFLVDIGFDSIRSARLEENAEAETEKRKTIPSRFTSERVADLIDEYLKLHPEVDFDKDYCQRTRYETMAANFAARRGTDGD